MWELLFCPQHGLIPTLLFYMTDWTLWALRTAWFNLRCIIDEFWSLKK